MSCGSGPPGWRWRPDVIRPPDPGRGRRRVRFGAPGPTLTPVAGMVALTELAGRLRRGRPVGQGDRPSRHCSSTSHWEGLDVSGAVISTSCTRR
jgi:hypothetical protein